MSETVLTRDQNDRRGNSDMEIESIIDGGAETLDMGIASDAFTDIIDILSDQSSNPGRYALREAFSNAYDATYEAGDMTLPIEIELPHAVDGAVTVPELVVRDHGVGMDTDTVVKAFTQYGGSRKHGRQLVGSKGLGSKAPFACSDQFSVRTVKDGVETFIVLERTPEKNVFSKPRVRDVNEGNGTEVRVPVSDKRAIRQMEEYAEELRRWNLDANLVIDGKGTDGVLTRGEGYVYLGVLDVGVDGDGRPVKFRMWEREDCFPDDNPSVIDVVIGGIRYRLAEPMSFYFASRDSGSPASLIVAGDPGYLNFDPSRDNIVDDKARERFIGAIRSAISEFGFKQPLIDRRRELGSLIRFVSWAHSRRCEPAIENGVVTLSKRKNLSEHPFTCTLDLTKDFRDDVSALAGRHTKFRAVMYDSKDSKHHHSMLTSKYQRAAFSPIRKTEVPSNAHALRTDVIGLMTASELDSGMPLYAVKCADDEELRAFLNSEAYWRKANHDPEMCCYLFVDADLTDDDIELLGDVRTFTAEEALREAKDYRRRTRASGPRTKRDGGPFAGQSASSASVDLGGVDVAAFMAGKDGEMPDVSSVPLTDLLDEDTVVVLRDQLSSARICSDAAYAKLLVMLGQFEAKRLLVCCDVRADAAQRLLRNGMRLLLDRRVRAKRLQSMSDVLVERGIASEGDMYPQIDLSACDSRLVSSLYDRMPVAIDASCMGGIIGNNDSRTYAPSICGVIGRHEFDRLGMSRTYAALMFCWNAIPAYSLYRFSIRANGAGPYMINAMGIEQTADARRGASVVAGLCRQIGDDDTRSAIQTAFVHQNSRLASLLRPELTKILCALVARAS